MRAIQFPHAVRAYLELWESKLLLSVLITDVHHSCIQTLHQRPVGSAIAQPLPPNSLLVSEH